MIKKITKVERQKKNSKRYSVFINDEFAFGVHEDILIKYELLKGKELDDAFIDDVIKAKEQNKANSYSLKLLSYRARSQKEIEKKMQQKGYEEETILNTIKYLIKCGYIDDRQFTYSFIKDKSNLKKYGKRRIQMELIQHGIDKDIIQELIEELMNNNDEYERALELAIKKINTSYKKNDKKTQYSKLAGFLQRRGYDISTIKKVLQEVL